MRLSQTAKRGQKRPTIPFITDPGDDGRCDFCGRIETRSAELRRQRGSCPYSLCLETQVSSRNGVGQQLEETKIAPTKPAPPPSSASLPDSFDLRKPSSSS